MTKLHDKPLNYVLAVLRRMYGEKLVNDLFNKWQGKEVKNFKLYFAEICRREYWRIKENDAEMQEIIKSKSGWTKKGLELKNEMLEKIKLKDIFKEQKEMDDRYNATVQKKNLTASSDFW